MIAPSLSVVVPAFDEAARIAPTLRSIACWLTARSVAGEVLVVDDGSTDGTAAVVAALGLPDVTVIESRPNRGKGHAVRLGMLRARGERRLFMDADGATPIDALPVLMEAIDAGADIAIGSRRAPGAALRVPQPWYRRAWSGAANRVVQRVLLDGIRDTQCGFKLFRAPAAEAIFRRARVDGWGFDLEVLALARRLGMVIAERGVPWSDDRRTRIRPLRDAMRVTRELLQIRRTLGRTAPDVAVR